jgi:hypothetical protein
MQSDTADRQQNDIKEQQRIAREDAGSYMRLGGQSAGMLQNYLQEGGRLNKGFSMSDFQQDPSYQWRMNQGTNALQAGGAAQGNYFSGTMGTALQDYGQNAASQEYMNAFNRWNTENNNLFQRLFNTEQVGANQGQGVNGMGAQAVAQQGQYAMAGTNAQVQGMQSIGQGALQGYNAYNQYQNAQAYKNMLDQNSLAGSYGALQAGGTAPAAADYSASGLSDMAWVL